MSEPTIESRVREVVAATFRIPLEQVTEATRMSNPPAWDSLGHMGLVVALEKEFGVRFPVYALPDLVTLSAIVDALGKHGANR